MTHHEIAAKIRSEVERMSADMARWNIMPPPSTGHVWFVELNRLADELDASADESSDDIDSGELAAFMRDLFEADDDSTAVEIALREGESEFIARVERD
jgi:hypothetical protein